ncbi:MAG: butyrate kinase [Synergistaceae bacterium]|nr:butyrate kinase [Synergistaceae bacterium]
MNSILAVNPGSTSTKIAWFHDDKSMWQETIIHSNDELAPFKNIVDQFEFRLKAINDCVTRHGNSFSELSCVVGRGGIVDPIPGGTYSVDEPLLARLRVGKPWEHASNLGGIIARAIASPLGLPSFIVDPVAVDELDEISKISGLPELTKPSLAHALNIKATVRRAARDLNVKWDEANYVVAHLGGGFTICAHRAGKMIDINSSNEYGPFSPERAGGLPAKSLVDMSFSGEYTEKDLKRKLAGKGGMVAYLGTSDLREVNKIIESGGEAGERASLVIRAMAWQVAKEIAAQAVSLRGKVDAILFTGGIAHDSNFVKLVQERIGWIAPCLIYAGEDEMQALTEGALRVLRGEEESKSYSQNVRGSNI